MNKFLEIIMQGDLVTVLRRYADIVLAFLVMAVVGMMIVPVPPFLLDLLLVLNISISMIMLLIAMYIPEPLKLASFPTIILVTTMFRLALNVSSTRLILLQADAGQVIRAGSHDIPRLQAGGTALQRYIDRAFDNSDP